MKGTLASTPAPSEVCGKDTTTYEITLFKPKRLGATSFYFQQNITSLEHYLETII